MRKISNAELGRKSVDEFRSAPKIPVIIVLDNVRSLHNVGSVFRTADAFLCRAVYLCGITGVPPHREIEKTALGATDTVEWNYFPTTTAALEKLRKENALLIAIEQAEGGTPLEDFEPVPAKIYALIFGHEIHGVSEEVMQHVDAALEIPQSGTKHSLNISVCAGIVIHHFFNFLKK